MTTPFIPGTTLQHIEFWDDDDRYESHKHVNRPTEEMVFAHILFGATYPFDDSLYNSARNETEFDNTDWILYLLLDELKGYIRFGWTDESRKTEREALKNIGENYLYMSFYQVISCYAELVTKMNRRIAAGLPEVPDIPKGQKKRLEAMLRRDRSE